MEQGPMALFGAIVAVGLGPALWLGVQLAEGDTPTPKPPVTIRQQLPAAVTDQGGYGAGEESDSSAPGVGWTLPPSTRPATSSPSPSPSVSTPVTSPSPSPSASPSVSVSVPASAEPSEPSEEPSDPPTESTGSVPPTDEASEPSTPPDDADDEPSASAPDLTHTRTPV